MKDFVDYKWKNDSYMDKLHDLMQIAQQENDIYAMLLIDEEMKKHMKEKEEHTLLFEQEG